ncbi:hypothetical protein [Salibacter sp.]|uniref:hypothetical protein n=1 Tax=Salibacter sp. TaxID=2010995 RepID=UPI00287075DB|nr:hypothetical protein [Salibacter sp.]MDR9397725.1 hypothetical protein [Salibacter sp.]MDR9487244.1 hypothetical protein [Salibacter sp.]
MHPVLRNVLIVIGGLIIGSFVNMGIIMISGSIIPPPEGVDPSNMESLKNGMDQFEAKHFLFPFLAHALALWWEQFLRGSSQRIANKLCRSL